MSCCDVMADIFAAEPAGRSNIGCLRGAGRRRRSGEELGGRSRGRQDLGPGGGLIPSQEISLHLKAQNRTAY